MFARDAIGAARLCRQEANERTRRFESLFSNCSLIVYVLEAAQSAALIQERRERQQRQQLDSVTLEKTKDEVLFLFIFRINNFS